MCFRSCLLDTDPGTEIVEAECTVSQTPPDGSAPIVVPECLRDPNTNAYVVDEEGRYQMSDDTDACYALLVDRVAYETDAEGNYLKDQNGNYIKVEGSGLTTSEYDDIAAECLEDTLYAEFKFQRRPGTFAAEGTKTKARCQLSTNVENDCPGLGLPASE